MSDLTSVTVHEGVATVTMHRPEKRNALSRELIDALGDAVAEIAAKSAPEGDVRAVILAGEGKSFCAGMDLQGVIDDAAMMAGMLETLSHVSRAIRRLPIPTIARVQGGAVGGGCGLMVACDFALTHAESKVGYPEVSLGVTPAVVAPWLMKKVGAGRARALLLEGGTVSGEEALRLGMATHLVPRDDLEVKTHEFAQQLAKGGAHAMAVTKRWLNELDGSLDDAVFEKAWRLSAEVIAGAEAQERLRQVFAR